MKLIKQFFEENWSSLKRVYLIVALGLLIFPIVKNWTSPYSMLGLNYWELYFFHSFLAFVFIPTLAFAVWVVVGRKKI